MGESNKQVNKHRIIPGKVTEVFDYINSKFGRNHAKLIYVPT